MRLLVDDLETYPNFFLFGAIWDDTGDLVQFEISERMNQIHELLAFLQSLRSGNVLMVGYNSLAFDYPILDDIIANPYTSTYERIYALAQEIIRRQNESQFQQFGYVKPADRYIPQCDLMKMNHFDNPAKRTRLKDLQFAMRLESVEDLPYEMRPLNGTEMEVVKAYNAHDLEATRHFLQKCKPHINLRQDLVDTGVLKGDVLNFSDVKIGTEIMIKRVGYNKFYRPGGKKIQTMREVVAFKDVILPKIKYYNENFDAVLAWFKQQSVYINSEDRPSLETKLAGLDFHFGVGGVHASVESKHFKATDTHAIIDIDVSGMYPAIAIANRFYPEHLGASFVDVYRQLQQDRKQHAKGSTMNLVLKLASNGVYGNSKNPYSPFYDPKYTYAVTVNGQLQLIQLIEMLSMIPGLQVIQANTDGTTVMLPREMEALFKMWCEIWERETGLVLEENRYTNMWIRDVNNYVAIDEKGKVKRKGAYWYPETEEDYWGGSGTNWHKDFSNMSAQKGVEACLLYGCTPKEAVSLIFDKFDFMMRYKVTGSSKVFIGNKQMPRTVRYYVSTAGEKMRKVSEPTGRIGDFKRKNGLKDAEYQTILAQIPAGSWDPRIHTKNKSKYTMKGEGIHPDRLVKCCNKASDFNWKDLDRDYYANEIRKLLIGED